MIINSIFYGDYAIQSNSHRWACLCRGIPLPTMQWYRKGRLFHSATSRVNIYRTVFGFDYMTDTFLDIHNIQKSDEDFYSCKGENGITSTDGRDFHHFPFVDVEGLCDYDCIERQSFVFATFLKNVNTALVLNVIFRYFYCFYSTNSATACSCY